MYTMQPVLDQYWNSHGGFYAAFCMAAFLIVATFSAWREGELPDTLALTFLIVIMGITGLIHENSYQPEVKYENRRVIGTFVEFKAEGFTERSGKSHVERHYAYVIYEIEGRRILFDAKVGMSYPDRAVFYYNRNKE